MSLGGGWIAAGMTTAALVLPLFGRAMIRATPERDFAADFAYDEVALAHPQRAIVQGTMSADFDSSDVRASVDGVPASIAWTDHAFAVPLLPMTPGAHVLVLGRRYGGGIERTIALPIVTGPFANRSDWIDSAVEISLAPDQIDDRDPATGADLAGAMRTYIRHHVTRRTPLGLLIDCPIAVSLGSDENSVLLSGTAYFQRGGVVFRVRLRFSQVGPQRLAITATNIEAEPNNRAMRFAHDGAGAAIVSALSRNFAGHDSVSSIARIRTQTSMEELVRGFLPHINNAMQVPAWIDLSASMNGVSAEVRFHGPPRFLRGGAMSIRLDVRFVGADVPASVRGPLQLEPLPESVPDGHAHLRLSAALTAAALNIFSVSGGLETALNGALSAIPHSDGTLHIDDLRVDSPGVFQVGVGGAPVWVLPDVQIDTHGDAGALHREIHAFVEGSFDARLGPDGAAVVLLPIVHTIALNCRQHPPAISRFVPCMSDVVTTGIDLAALVNRNIAAINLFGATLDDVARLRIVGAIPIAIDVRSLAIDRHSGQPVLDLASELAFVARDEAASALP